ncbi:oligosaccharide flippase family protein [Flavobacteriales bacterium]|nr:oligosaccharide flippase family protein [Flavobacteriales bacterium]
MNSNKKLLVIMDQIIVSASNFFVSYYLALKLSLEDFGIYSLFFAVLMLIFAFYNALLFQPYQLNSMKKHIINKGSLLYSTSLILICIQLLLFIYLYLSSNLEAYKYGFIIYLGFFILHEMNRKILLTERRYLKLLFIDFIGYGMRILFIILFLSNFTEIYYLFYVLGLSYFLSVLLLKHRIQYFSFNIFKEYFHLGKWLLAIAIVYWLGSQFSIFILGYIHNVALVGVFSALLIPLGVIRIIQIASESYLLPILSEHYNKTKKNIRQYIIRESYLFYLIIIVIYLLLFMFGDYFLELFYHNKFDDYRNIFTYLIIYGFLQSIVFQINIYYKIIDNTKLLYKINKNVLYISLPVTIFAVYFYGLIGLVFALIFISLMNLILLIKSIFYV